MAKLIQCVFDPSDGLSVHIIDISQYGHRTDFSDVSLVSINAAMMIFELDVLHVVDVVHARLGKVVWKNHAGSATQCMRFVAKVIRFRNAQK